MKIVTDFVKQNARYRDQLSDLNAFLRDGTVLPSVSRKAEPMTRTEHMPKTSVDASNVRSSSGPLGELSTEYEVQLERSEGEQTREKEVDIRREPRGRFWPPSKLRSSKPEE